MRFRAQRIKAIDLKPGDLFSNAGPEYWEQPQRAGGKYGVGVGEKVYIRTEAPTPKDQADEEIFKITIEQGAT